MKAAAQSCRCPALCRAGSGPPSLPGSKETWVAPVRSAVPENSRQLPASSAVGLRLPGGRHFKMLQIYTSLALHAAGGDDLVEQLPGRADERLALLVFLFARRFADEAQVRIERARRRRRFAFASRPALCSARTATLRVASTSSSSRALVAATSGRHDDSILSHDFRAAAAPDSGSAFGSHSTPARADCRNAAAADGRVRSGVTSACLRTCGFLALSFNCNSPRRRLQSQLYAVQAASRHRFGENVHETDTSRHVHAGSGADALRGRAGSQSRKNDNRDPQSGCGGGANRLSAGAVSLALLLPARRPRPVRPGRADPRPSTGASGRRRPAKRRPSWSHRCSSGVRPECITTRPRSSTPTAACSACIARCTFPTIRCTTRSITSRPATWVSGHSTRAIGRIGVLVCWDQWFPEAARLTALHGAEVLFYPTAIGWHPREKDGVRRGAARRLGDDPALPRHRQRRLCRGGQSRRPRRAGGRRHRILGHIVRLRSVRRHARRRRRTTAKNCWWSPCDRRRIEDVRRNWPFFRDRRIDAYRG